MAYSNGLGENMYNSVKPSWARSCVRGWMASKPHDTVTSRRKFYSIQSP